MCPAVALGPALALALALAFAAALPWALRGIWQHAAPFGGQFEIGCLLALEMKCLQLIMQQPVVTEYLKVVNHPLLNRVTNHLESSYLTMFKGG